jgi:uncharacterized protein YunC (DUF1805 family)
MVTDSCTDQKYNEFWAKAQARANAFKIPNVNHLCAKKVPDMISVTHVMVDGKACLGVRVELPNSPPLVLITSENGFVMCGFLNVETAEKLGVAAAVVSGVNSPEDVLDAQVKAATSAARNLGVETGMKGAEALRRLS